MIKLFGNRLDYLHEKFVINEKRKQDKLARNNKIHKEGFDAGYKKGYKKGLRDLADEMNRTVVGDEDSIMVAVKMFRSIDELLQKKRQNGIKKH